MPDIIILPDLDLTVQLHLGDISLTLHFHDHNRAPTLAPPLALTGWPASSTGQSR